MSGYIKKNEKPCVSGYFKNRGGCRCYNGDEQVAVEQPGVTYFVICFVTKKKREEEISVVALSTEECSVQTSLVVRFVFFLVRAPPPS